MTNEPIQHVADTAFWVATFRAREGTRPDALFQDPVAARLVEGRGEAITARMKGAGIVGWLVVIRTLIIDELLRSAIADGCDAVLDLGAGLDTRPYRLGLPPSFLWIEVDFPETIAFKNERLAGTPASCPVERLAVDLTNASARDAMLDSIAARAKKILVLTEGVVPYLTNEDVASLAEALRARPAFSWWILEQLSPEAREMRERASPHRKQMTRAPFQFKPDDWESFFGTRGWTIARRRTLFEEADARRRYPQISLWQKIAMSIFVPKKKREAMRNAYAYALLQRS